MNMQDVITLRSVSVEVDDYGVPQETTSEKTIFARVESVSAAEFFNAGQNGLKPDYRFLVNAWEYSDEPEAVFQTYMENCRATSMPRRKPFSTFCRAVLRAVNAEDWLILSTRDSLSA